MTREFYRKAIVIREFMIQCEAWFATWNTSYPWISSFISWNPQDFPETFYTRREIWSFAFPIRDAWIFLKILALNPFRIMSLTLSHRNQGKSIIFNQCGDIYLRDVDQFRCVEDKFDGHKFNEIKIPLHNKTKYGNHSTVSRWIYLCRYF